MPSLPEVKASHIRVFFFFLQFASALGTHPPRISGVYCIPLCLPVKIFIGVDYSACCMYVYDVFIMFVAALM